MKHSWRVATTVAFCLVAAVAGSQDRVRETVDLGTLAKIRDEGLSHSQAMDHIGWLSDVYGPRVTGTPAFRQAGEWIMKRLTEWGLSNVHQEKWPLGKGWSLVRFSAHLIEPQIQPLIGYPKGWTPGTKGMVTADVVRAAIASEADFATYHGKLAGKIVLTQPAREVKMLEGPIIVRWTPDYLREAETTPIPPPPFRRPEAAAGQGGRSVGQTLEQKIQSFFQAEGVVATFDRGSDAYTVAAGGSDYMSWQTQRTDGGTIFPGNGGDPRDPNSEKGVPSVTLAVEHYNRMIRILEKGVPVKVELNVQTRFYDETDMNGANIIADLPGSDLANEVVLIGAHMDTVPFATGATDNATGTAAMMEAMRILKTVGAKPRRTIRIGLWGGEEEGLLGSRAYVRDHLGDPASGPTKPEHSNLSAYYNIDNGTGRIHGVWLQGNIQLRSIFTDWIQPLRDLGVTTLAPRSIGGSDYASFDAVGIPAFQLMQDRLEYNSRTHHSNMDTVDRVQRDDVVQIAVVVAALAYDTAMRAEKLPRKGAAASTTPGAR